MKRLDVYRISIAFVALSDQRVSALPRGRAYLADQLRRAASSIPLNVAEGAGEFAAADQARWYRFARRSATESAAIIDALVALELTYDSLQTRGRGLLLRMVAMLTAMVLKISGSLRLRRSLAPQGPCSSANSAQLSWTPFASLAGSGSGSVPL